MIYLALGTSKKCSFSQRLHFGAEQSLGDFVPAITTPLWNWTLNTFYFLNILDGIKHHETRLKFKILEQRISSDGSSYVCVQSARDFSLIPQLCPRSCSQAQTVILQKLYLAYVL